MSPLVLMLWSAARADTCFEWGAQQRSELREAPFLDESSGIVPVRGRPGAYFTIEDSGGDPQLYAFTRDGLYLGASEVRGATNVDWEDLAAGPCPPSAEPGGPTHCVYIGDIGDNKRARDHVVIYVVPEPTIGQPIVPAATWTLRYPTGPQDAETLLVYPGSARVYVVTKDKGGFSDVFRVPATPGPGADLLEPVTRLDVQRFPGGSGKKITGGDFDADGDRMVLRSYHSAWEWQVDPCRPEDHWAAPPTAVDVGLMVQPEAITYSHDGGLVTTSEGAPMPITVLTCTKLLPESSPCLR